MKITRKSILTGNENTLDLPVTQEQLDDYYKHRMPLVDAFPHLSAIEREFIRHGVTAEEKQQIFGSDKSSL